MKRNCSSKPSILGHSRGNKTNRYRTLSIKKTDKHRPTYRTKTPCTSTNFELQQKDVDLNLLSALRQEAYDELHRQMQQYNDSFVFEMQQVELQSRLTAVDAQRRRSSLTTQLLHRLPRRTSSTCQQHEEIEELVDLFETGTIKDYSLVTDWELCQKQQLKMNEDQGGLGDMW